MRLGYIAWIALAGCDSVFDLRERVDAAPPDVAAIADEDGDGIANVADNCPGVTNPDQAAAQDTDAVGDACDPNPTLAGDVLFEFESFDDVDAADAIWFDNTINGKWSYADGRAAHPDAADSVGPLQHRVPIDTQEVTIEVAYQFLSWDPLLGPRIGLVIDSQQNMVPGHSCWLNPPMPAETRLELQELLDGGAGGDGSSKYTRPLAFEDRVRITFTRRVSPQQLDCRMERDGMTLVLTTFNGTAAWSADRYLGLYVRNAAVVATHITIYVRP